MKTFDPQAAKRFFRDRWMEALYDAALGPLETLVSGLEKQFANVPIDKRASKNKVPKFRFRDKKNEVLYNMELQQFRNCATVFNNSLQTVMEYVAEAHEGSYDELKVRFFATMDRWRKLRPNNLRGRTDEGILNYTQLYHELVELCLLDMFHCEEQMYEHVLKKRRHIRENSTDTVCH